MTLSEKAQSNPRLNAIIEMMVSDLMNGVLLKNVKKSLENKGLPKEMVNKLVRIAEIEANQMGGLI